MEQIIGTLTELGTLTGELSQGSTLGVSMSVPERIQTEAFEGEYEYTPSNETQTIEISGKRATSDITINPMPELQLQTKSATPSETAQTVTADAGYDGLSEVAVEAVSSTYVGTGVTRRSGLDLSVNGPTVNVPGGYYEESASKAIASGTAGTPTASKGTVSGHAVTVTPSVTNTTGYITGSTISGTGVSVSAGELVSGNKAITENGTGIDVANYATVSVNVAGQSINNQDKSVTPSESAQSVTADSGYTGLGTVSVGAISSSYVGSGITRRSSSDLTASGATVTAPAGYYESSATKTVASGTAGTPTATKGTVSNNSISITPSVTNTTGYITGSTKTGTAVTVSASELVSGSQTITQNSTVDVTNLASVVVNVSGGGGGIGTLLNTTSLGTISTSSTTAADTGKSLSVSGINSYDLLIVEASVDTVTNNRHTATVATIWLTASSTVGTKDGGTIATAKWNSKISSSAVTTTRAGTTAYGIYPNSISISSGTATIPMYRRYNSTSTGTINGSYTARVYGVKLYDLIGG